MDISDFSIGCRVNCCFHLLILVLIISLNVISSCFSVHKYRISRQVLLGFHCISLIIFNILFGVEINDFSGYRKSYIFMFFISIISFNFYPALPRYEYVEWVLLQFMYFLTTWHLFSWSLLLHLYHNGLIIHQSLRWPNLWQLWYLKDLFHFCNYINYFYYRW